MPMSMGRLPSLSHRELSAASRTRISSAAATAARASASGPSVCMLPQTAITASPMNLSSVPRCLKTTSTISPRYSLSCAMNAAGSSADSVSVVKPRTSEKRMVTQRRSPRTSEP